MMNVMMLVMMGAAGIGLLAFVALVAAGVAWLVARQTRAPK